MQTYGSEQEILSKAIEWLHQGYDVVLVTVLKTWGSSPRPEGSLMLMRKDGISCGSVSGGCVEEDLTARYRDEQLGQFPTKVNYGVKREDATRFGLPCGGRLELLLEQLDDIEALQQLLSAIQQHRLLARHVDLQTGQVTLQRVKHEQDFTVSNIFVRKVFGPQWQMLLIGAGHLSYYVSQMAMMLGYRVIVCEPREEYASEWQIVGTRLTTSMPDEAVEQFAQQARSVVIALTHDPKLDDMALLDALQSPAFYVGAIGSQKNCAARRERLQSLGITATQLQRLHAPVGVPIGSHTPAEIAVSILAEVTQQRNAASQVTTASVSIV